MSMYGVYSVKDVKAFKFGLPFFSRNDETARREALGLLNDETTLVHAYPEDFELYRLGSFDDESGRLFLSDYDNPDYEIELMFRFDDMAIHDEAMRKE